MLIKKCESLKFLTLGWVAEEVGESLNVCLKLILIRTCMAHLCNSHQGENDLETLFKKNSSLSFTNMMQYVSFSFFVVYLFFGFKMIYTKL